MNYQAIYNSIIDTRKNKPVIGYGEKHHIVPRCLGGLDNSSNVVKLTAREHFVCHCLLAKMYKKESNEWYKMNHAFMMMKTAAKTHNRYFNSHLYHYFKANFSSAMQYAQKGDKNSQYGSKWIYNDSEQVSKKIPKCEPMPNGWLAGRKLKWTAKKTNCLSCHVEFKYKPNTSYCSTACRKTSRLNALSGREEELLSAYTATGSINKALKQLGFPGAVGGYYYLAKEILKK